MTNYVPNHVAILPNENTWREYLVIEFAPIAIAILDIADSDGQLPAVDTDSTCDVVRHFQFGAVGRVHLVPGERRGFEVVAGFANQNLFVVLKL